MSNIKGNQYIYGEVYISGVGGYSGTVNPYINSLSNVVNKTLFSITDSNISAYHTTTSTSPAIDVLELMNPAIITYSGVQIEQSTYSTLRINLPVAPAMTIGTEFSVLNLSKSATLQFGSPPYSLSSGRMILVPTSANGVSISAPQLGFLKMVRLKSVAVKSGTTTYYGWVVISATPTSLDIVSA